MKLILTESVPGLGGPGDVVQAKDGYARNFLVPRRKAVAWTPGAEKQIEGIKRTRRAREIRDLGHAQEVKAELEALTVRLPARAGSAGRLFGSITADEVARAIRDSGGPPLDRRAVTLPGSVRALGAFRAVVRLHPDVTAEVTVEVVAA